MATTRETNVVTVAVVRKGKDKAYQYLFNERQRIFSLAEKAAATGDSARLLAEALDKRIPVKVTFDTKRPLILGVSAPSKRELEALRAAAASGDSVRVRFSAPNSELIESVRADR